MLIVREYLDESGRSPFREWLTSLDQASRARVQARVLRLELGNLGDHKQIGGGVWEARLTFRTRLPRLLRQERRRTRAAPGRRR
jgi:putative component of toxin-antitoxin plasmid stabilization module